jgi:ribose transport system permease protein
MKRLRLDPSVVVILVGCVLLLLGGSLFVGNFLTSAYLLQQLQIASFLGILAAGAMLVILLGHIDLSFPWVLTGSAIVVTTLGGASSHWVALSAVPLGLAFGFAIGLINGLVVAKLRIPSLVWTLAVNSMLLGIAIYYQGEHRPQGHAPALVTELAVGTTFGIPNAFLLWLAVSAVVVFLLRGTTFGRLLFAIGNNEKAVFLAGARPDRATILAFALAGLLAGLVGILLAGYANQAYQGMGNPYLMPTIAAVVIGGTSILGGRGNYAGTFVGAFFVTLLLSILSVIQIAEATRQIIFGGLILVMLVLDGIRTRWRTG